MYPSDAVISLYTLSKYQTKSPGMGWVHWFHAFGEIVKWGVLEWVCENRQLRWCQTWNPVFLFNTEVASMNPLPHVEKSTHCEECLLLGSAVIPVTVLSAHFDICFRSIGQHCAESQNSWKLFWQISRILEMWLTFELRLKELEKIKDSIGTIMFQAHTKGSDLWPVLLWLQVTD
jgi:hypothetical protein